MFCKNCGAEVKDGAQFCPKCGTKVAQIAQQTAIPQNPPKEKNINIEQLLKNLNIDEFLKKCNIDRILKNVTKRQLTYIGAVALAVILAIVLISGVKKGSDKDVAYLEQEDINREDTKQENAERNYIEQNNEEPKSADKNMRELTLNEQLSLMKEYMDTGNIAEEELLNVMVEQHLYEPDLYLGLADIMIARNHSDSAIDVLVTGYQYTNDEQIKSKLLDLQTRAKVGDGNADKIDQALGLAEDIADDLGYGETVEKGKNVFDTIYGYYLENK